MVEAGRQVLNDFIRTSGLFDGVEELDAATLDTATGKMKTVYPPNSQLTQLPGTTCTRTTPGTTPAAWW